MLFTFSEEISFGTDSTSQEYTVDIISEDVISNMEYEKTREFHKPTRNSRYNTVRKVEGRVSPEFTFVNPAWNILFKTLMGQKIRLTDFSLVFSPEEWKVVTGMLSVSITSTQTTFTINEYKTGEFDNVDGVIINNEYIAISAISNGSVTGSTRGSEGSTAASHGKNALVYGVVTSGGKYVDIISRYRSSNEFCFTLPNSLTCLIYREGDYFCFPGTQFSDFVFNSRSAERITTSLMMRSKYSKIIAIANPSTATDDEELVAPYQMDFYSMGEHLDLINFYFQVSNSLTPGLGSFFDESRISSILNGFAVYGQFSPVISDSQYFTDYQEDEYKNISAVMCDDIDLGSVFVFSFNDVKWGTMIHTLRSRIIIHDSIPFYVFGENSFTILIQGITS